MKIGGSNINQNNSGANLNLSDSSAATSSGGGISLAKGQKVSLSKISLDKGNTMGLDNIMVGLGWDVNNYSGNNVDLDAQAFLLGTNDKVPANDYFVFYGQSSAPQGCVVHSGDNKTGVGSGDDETLDLQLSKVPAEIQKVIFTVTIHEARTRNQNFGQVSNAFIRVVDKATSQELIRYDLSEDFSVETALVVGEIYRYNDEWKFNPVGSGYPDELADFCARYGVTLA